MQLNIKDFEAANLSVSEFLDEAAKKTVWHDYYFAQQAVQLTHADPQHIVFGGESCHTVKKNKNL